MNVRLNHLPKSANATGKHWRWRHTEVVRWRKIIGAVIGHKIPPEEDFLTVRIIMYRHQKQDPDNAYASVKPVLDALKRYGWIKDDSLRWIKLEVSEQVERKKERQGVLITIT